MIFMGFYTKLHEQYDTLSNTATPIHHQRA